MNHLIIKHLKYFTIYANFILYISVIIHFLLKKFPERFSEKTKQNFKNIIALSYGIIIATSITGTIIINFYRRNFIIRNNVSSVVLLISDLILHLIPLIIISNIAPD